MGQSLSPLFRLRSGRHPQLPQQGSTRVLPPVLPECPPTKCSPNGFSSPPPAMLVVTGAAPHAHFGRHGSHQRPSSTPPPRPPERPGPRQLLARAWSLTSATGAQVSNGSNSGQMEEINTKEVAQRITTELKRYSIPQAIFFAQRVLCRSPRDPLGPATTTPNPGANSSPAGRPQENVEVAAGAGVPACCLRSA